MPRPVVRAGGIVDIELSPPLAFIEDQAHEFQARLLNFTRLWERFADTLESVERDQFSTRGHGAWPPLAQSTIREKTAHGFPLDPLIRTGELERSLTTRERALRMDPQRMTWGTSVPYAKYHQGYRDEAGTPTLPGRPPVRRVLELTVADRRRLEADMVAWINEVATETFRRAA